MTETNQGITMEITVKRGVVNEWSRQEVFVLLADITLKTRWVPVTWSDSQIVASLLFDVSISDKDTLVFPVSDEDRLDVARQRLGELNGTQHGLSQAGLATQINHDTGCGMDAARLVVQTGR